MGPSKEKELGGGGGAGGGQGSLLELLMLDIST